MHKENALQNALAYNFVLHSPVRFSEFEGENSIPANEFSKTSLYSLTTYLYYDYRYFKNVFAYFDQTLPQYNLISLFCIYGVL